MKAQFTYGPEKYEVYWNGKEYRQGTIYLSVTRVGGTQQHKGSYSKSQEAFVDYRAGDLDLMKSAARALNIIA